MEVPPHVGEVEYTTPARIPAHRLSRPQRRADRIPTPPPTPPTSSSPLSIPIPRSLTTPQSLVRDLISGQGAAGDDDGVSTVVREAVDNLLLNVVKQLQHDLLHGPAQTRSKIASQFLPRIMRLLDKEEAEDQSQLEELRIEMQRLNEEMLNGEPRLYTPVSTATPDSDDLPVVDPTGLVVERAQLDGG